MPAFRPRYALVAPSITVMERPSRMARKVSSRIRTFSGTKGLKAAGGVLIYRMTSFLAGPTQRDVLFIYRGVVIVCIEQKLGLASPCYEKEVPRVIGCFVAPLLVISSG